MTCSNFPDSYTNVTAAETYEGENTVLLLQTARYFYKSESHEEIVLLVLEELNIIAYFASKMSRCDLLRSFPDTSTTLTVSILRMNI